MGAAPFPLKPVCVCAPPYGYFLLCDNHNAVFPPDPHGRQTTLRDGFEGILCVTHKQNEIKRLFLRQQHMIWCPLHESYTIDVVQRQFRGMTAVMECNTVYYFYSSAALSYNF